MTRFTSLADHKFRIYGLLISVVAVILLVTLHILNYQYEEEWHDRIFIINHFIIVFGLYMIMFSKEIHDDERVQRIRYNLLKVNYTLTICGILAYIAVTTLDRVTFSIYIVFYIIEIALIVYQLLFRYCLAANPNWIFKEATRNKFAVYYVFFSLLFLIGWIIYVVIKYKI
jgi:hypothetical protein